MRLFGIEIKRAGKVEVPPPPRAFCQAETMAHFGRTITIARDIAIGLAAWRLYDVLSHVRTY